MKKLLLAILILTFPIASIYLYKQMQQAYIKVEVKPNIDKELREKATKPYYLQEHIATAINSDNIDEAKEYIDIANYLQVPIDSGIMQSYKKANTPLKKGYRNTKNFFKGFIFGESENGASLAGSITSDFTVVGDARDIYKEGKHYIKDEPYDKITLSLSVIGVALTASTVASFGAAAPVKATTSIVKAANKANKLTRGFKEILKTKLTKSVDLNVLKKVDFTSFSSIKKNGKLFIKSINLKPIESIAKDLNKIKKNSSTLDTVKLLKYVDNQKDLKGIIKLSNKYKSNTKGVMKILGKSAIRGSKFVIKKSIKYGYYLVSLLASIFGFFIVLIKFISSMLRS